VLLFSQGDRLTALEDGDRIIVPATVLAQVIRNPARQVRLWRMIQFDNSVRLPKHAQVKFKRRRIAELDSGEVALSRIQQLISFTAHRRARYTLSCTLFP